MAQGRLNVNFVWHPPKKGVNNNDDEIYVRKPSRHAYSFKSSTFRPKQASRRILKKEIRERRKESNALFRTIQEFTSIRVIRKVSDILACKIAHVNATDAVGQTPLMYAVRYQRDDKCLQLIDLLASYGANLNAKDVKGRSTLHLAIKYGNYLAAIHLIKRYSTLDLNVSCNKGKSPLKSCIQIGETTLEVIETLLSTRRVNVDATEFRSETKYQTALHQAALKGQLTIVQLLLDHGANIDYRDGNGQTPLMLASINFHSKVVQQLLQLGADQSITDPNGKTAAQLSADKFYGSGLETMNSFINPTLQPSPELSRKRPASPTQNDPPPTKKANVVVEPLIEEPEDDEIIEIPRDVPTETSAFQIVEVSDSEPENEDRSTWKVVPWKPPRAKSPSVHQKPSFSYQRPTVIAFSRIVHSPTKGRKRQTYFYGVQERQRSTSSNIHSTYIFRPPREI